VHNCRSARSSATREAGPVSEPADAVRITAAVRDLLPPTLRPWSIEVDTEPVTGGWEVSLQHEASHGLVYKTGDEDATGAIARVRQLMASGRDEFARVAAAPPLVHREDVMEIRALAHIFNWSRSEVKSVVRFVEDLMLTRDEGEWLSEWVGHDGPVPRPSSDF
jgi:hypothetical protein